VSAFKVDNDQTTFAGPTRLVPAPVAPAFAIDQAYAGVVGAYRLWGDGRTRKLLMSGQLRAASTTAALARTALLALRDAIDGLTVSGTSLAAGDHTLTTEDGIIYAHCVLDGFAPSGPIVTVQTGTSAWTALQDYQAVWTQLQPKAVT